VPDGDDFDKPAPARAGFVVGKTVGSAVVRNRVRRRLRHAMREPIKALPGGSRVVVRALPAAAKTDYAGLAAQVDSAVRAALRGRGHRSKVG
jgi:ribonuclease P protein component